MYVQRKVQMSITEPPFAIYYNKYKNYKWLQLKNEIAKGRPSYVRIQKYCLHVLAEEDYFNQSNPYVKQMYGMRDRLIVLEYLRKEYKG